MLGHPAGQQRPKRGRSKLGRFGACVSHSEPGSRCLGRRKDPPMIPSVASAPAPCRAEYPGAGSGSTAAQRRCVQRVIPWSSLHRSRFRCRLTLSDHRPRARTRSGYGLATTAKLAHPLQLSRTVSAAVVSVPMSPPTGSLASTRIIPGAYRASSSIACARAADSTRDPSQTGSPSTALHGSSPRSRWKASFGRSGSPGLVPGVS
jgi:hypothetical protein